jgi:hypothetical protein
MISSALEPDILATHRRRLQKLEQQAAARGYDTPPEVALEIEDLRKKVAADASVPEDDAGRFALLRDLILETRSDLRDLRRMVLWIAVLLPILVILVVKL